jgi:phage gp45-like
MSIIKKLMNLMRFGRVSNTTSDTGNYPSTQISYLGKSKDVVSIYPYGFSAKAPLNNLAIVLNMGQEEKSIAMPFSGDNRVKGLKPGETIVGNWETGSYVKFKDDSSIEVISNSTVDVTTTGNTNITSPTVAITGNLTVSGTIVGDSSISAATSMDAGTTILAGTTVTATAALVGASLSAGGVSGSGGTLSASEVTAGGISLTSHVHGGVTPGGGTTSGPQ